MNPPCLAYCSKLLSFITFEAWETAITAPKPDANSFSSVEPGGAIWIREAVSDESLMSKRLRTEDALLSPSAQIAIFLFPQLGERSNLLAALTEQQHHVVLQDRD